MNNEKCTECGSKDIIYSDRGKRCTQCGLVLDDEENYVVQEQKRPEKSKVNVISHELSTAEVRTIFIPTDAKFERLNKRNRAYSQKARVELNADFDIKKIAQALVIPEVVVEDSKRIYIEAQKKGILKKASIETLAAASLHAACRFHEIGIIYEDIVETVSYATNRNSVSRTVREIVKYVLPGLNMVFKPPNFSRTFFRISNALKISQQSKIINYDCVERCAFRIFTEYNKRIDNIEKSKDPKGQIASCLYIASVLCNSKIPQSAIAEIANITDVTLRTKMKHINETLGVGYRTEITERELTKNIEDILRNGEKQESLVFEELILSTWCPKKSLKPALSRIVEKGIIYEKCIDDATYYSLTKYI